MSEVWLWVWVAGAVAQMLVTLIMAGALVVLAVRLRALRAEVETQGAVILQLCTLVQPRQQVDQDTLPRNVKHPGVPGAARTMWSDPKTGGT